MLRKAYANSYQKKREIVLRKIAQEFKAGQKYTENEVNGVIHNFHEDHCTIRQEMVACGIITQEMKFIG
ncbi:MAG: DUF2087 domain-containing protein [Oscillospiraceae bacterium]|nr:DUF2087 domain-containing protein [Oscillospiraceae bacterium]